MRTSKYLYGLDPYEFASLPYLEALRLKLASAQKLVCSISVDHYTTRDDARLSQVLNAISHTRKLLAEATEANSSSYDSIEDFILPTIEERSKFC